MFTGIIEEMGKLKKVERGDESSVLTIVAKKVLEGTMIGDSIAVNGICLTAVELFPEAFKVDVMTETLKSSSVGELLPGDEVNLERALTLGKPLGGHMVSGHIDGTGTIRKLEKEDTAVRVTIGAGPELLKYIIKKGSIAIDGISLTVADVDETSLSVAVIPHTSEHTTLLEKQAGDTVNLECDMIGKYVEKLLELQIDPTIKV